MLISKIFIFSIYLSCYLAQEIDYLPPMRKIVVNDGLYEYLTESIKVLLPNGGKILDIGCGDGSGSTKALMNGIINSFKNDINTINQNKYTLHCIELQPPLCEDLLETYKDYRSIFHIHCGSSTSASHYDDIDDIERIIKENVHNNNNNSNNSNNNNNNYKKSIPHSWSNFTRNDILGWYEHELNVIKSNHRESLIKNIKQFYINSTNNNMNNGNNDKNINDDKICIENHLKQSFTFDLVVLDGSEFTTNGDRRLVYGSKYLVLCGVYGKNKLSKELLNMDSSYELLARGDAADGFLIYQRVVPLSYITGTVLYCASKAKEKERSDQEQRNESKYKREANQIFINSQFSPSTSSASLLSTKQVEERKGIELTTMSVEGMLKWAHRRNGSNSNSDSGKRDRKNSNSTINHLKIAVVSVAIGKNEHDTNDYYNKPWVQFAIKNHQSYCEKHGYSYHLKSRSDIGNNNDNDDNDDDNNNDRSGSNSGSRNRRSPHWEKVKYMKSIMTRMNDSVDYILWMDIDSIFTNTSISVEHIVKYYGVRDFAFAGESLIIRSGNMLFRNSYWSRQMLDDVWSIDGSVNMNNVTLDIGTGMDNAAFAIYLTGGKGKGQGERKRNHQNVDMHFKDKVVANTGIVSTSWNWLYHYYVGDGTTDSRGETTYFQNLYRSGDGSIYSYIAPHLWSHVTVLPIKALGSTPITDKYSGTWTPGDFIMHIPNQDDETRYQWMISTVPSAIEEDRIE